MMHRLLHRQEGRHLAGCDGDRLSRSFRDCRSRHLRSGCGKSLRRAGGASTAALHRRPSANLRGPPMMRIDPDLQALAEAAATTTSEAWVARMGALRTRVVLRAARAAGAGETRRATALLQLHRALQGRARASSTGQATDPAAVAEPAAGVFDALRRAYADRPTSKSCCCTSRWPRPATRRRRWPRSRPGCSSMRASPS